MGVEDIVAVIDREAREEATRIVAEAERRADELIAAAESGVQAQVDAAIERSGPEIRGAAQRRINAVRLSILEERARDDAARLVAVFDDAEARRELGVRPRRFHPGREAFSPPDKDLLERLSRRS